MRNELYEVRMRVCESQEQLARRVGVTRQTINAIENGRQVPSLALAIRIARRYGKAVEEVFDSDREPRCPRRRLVEDDWPPLVI